MNTYERVLGLRHVRLTGWQRELLGWGVLVVSVLLTLADLISPWGILLLPLAVALLIKTQDLLSGRLTAIASGLRASHKQEPPAR
jgi:hypothetical protein